MLGFFLLFDSKLLPIVFLALLCLPSGSLYSQGPEPNAPSQESEDLQAQVAKLIEQLAAAEIEKRDQAEQELLKLGTDAIEFLVDDADSATDVRKRIQSVRQKLESIATQQRLQPSQVTLTGKLTASQVLEAIGKQTGNRIQLPEGVAGSEYDKACDYNLTNVSFWKAFATLCKNNNLQMSPLQSESNFLFLVPVEDQSLVAELPTDNKSIFNVQVLRVDASRNLENPALNYCRLKCRVRWEPRVEPTSIDIPLDSIQIINEFDEKVDLKSPEGSISCVVQPGIPEVEFSLPLASIDRQIEELKSVKMKIDAVVPGRKEVFAFPDLGKIRPGAEIRKSGAIFTFDGADRIDEIYGVRIRIGFDETSRALESHQSWIFNNPLVLTSQTGEKIDNIGMETMSRTENEVGFQYFFSENPLEYGLEYQSAATITKLPVTILLKTIPLP